MLSIRKIVVRWSALFFLGLACCSQGHSQAALLLEEPYGFFGMLNPTGHVAIYFERVCAATPIQVRRCRTGELGAVIARYQGIHGYDWVAIPLVPYLYSVENTSEVPLHVDHDMVVQLRNKYRESHLASLGRMSRGNLVHGGWTQLVGAAYERRIYAFRFDTSPEQDDALIHRLNTHPNKSRFNLLFNNCADFSRVVLNDYFPRTFRRSIFPDAGMTTPKQITYKLVRYARKHPKRQLTAFEIRQIPGYRRESHSIKGIDESIVTTAYAIPLAIANPYIAGGLFVDYLVRGRFHLIPKDPRVLGPDNLSTLTMPAYATENLASTGYSTESSSSAESSAEDATDTASPTVTGADELQPVSDSAGSATTQVSAGVNSGLNESEPRMSKSVRQDFKNHGRFDPPYHFFLTFISLATIVISIVYAVHHLCFYSIWLIVLSFAAFIALFKMRLYPLKVQDRVIRLEERLRLQALAPAEWHSQIYRLSEDQLIGLRFAADDEVVELAKQALEHNLNRKQIKERIKDWRPDFWRV